MSTPDSSADAPPLLDLPAIERYRDAINVELQQVLTGRESPPYTLMRYHLGWSDRQGRPVAGRGGKLLRPSLCLLACEAVGGDWQRALPAAAAIELLHNFTLIHDDVEDASETRHGRDTLWTVWDTSQAINAGDGMFALAQATLLRLSQRGHEPSRVLRAAQLLDDATLRLCEGQHLDLIGAHSVDSREAYLAMIEGKTASLVAASCAIGALLGGARDDAVHGFYEFGLHLGLAFQVRDDVLGVWGDVGATGKAASDLRAGKRSFPVVAALERGSPAQRSKLEDALAAEGPSDDEVRAAKALLEALGAKEEAETAARDHAEEAVAQLRQIALDETSSLELEQLARFAADRTI